LEIKFGSQKREGGGEEKGRKDDGLMETRKGRERGPQERSLGGRKGREP